MESNGLSSDGFKTMVLPSHKSGPNLEGDLVSSASSKE